MSLLYNYYNFFENYRGFLNPYIDIINKFKKLCEFFNYDDEQDISLLEEIFVYATKHNFKINSSFSVFDLCVIKFYFENEYICDIEFNLMEKLSYFMQDFKLKKRLQKLLKELS